MDVKGLLVMDVDGTLVQEEGIDLLAHQAGVGEKVARLTSKAMNGHPIQDRLCSPFDVAP